MVAITGVKLILALLLFVKASFSTCTTDNTEKFQVEFSWDYLNFTWQSQVAYQAAVDSGRYVPGASIFSAAKFYKNQVYLSLPRFASGTPVTLATFPILGRKNGPLLKPYPSGFMNVQKLCNTLQNVASIEIDRNGIMWIIDGNRYVNLTQCPQKIVLIDINQSGKVLQMFEIPEELSARHGGWLTTLVVDETDGGYAYIAECSAQDPGIIVYSRRQNRAWKVRDSAMFAQKDANIVINGVLVQTLFPVSGTALDPISKQPKEDRRLYFSALDSYNLYAIKTNILKNESLFSTYTWREFVEHVGQKCGQSKGLIVDNTGVLYYTLVSDFAIGKWNTQQKPLDEFQNTIYQNETALDWPDTFGMDNGGNLYVTAPAAERLVANPSGKPIKLRILKRHIGTKSYLYS